MYTGKYIACLLALVVAGCSNSQSTTSPTTTTTTATSESDYTATLAIGGSFNSPPFTVAAAGTAAIDLESVTLTPTGPATLIQLGIGLSPTTTDGTGKTVCGSTTSSMTVASGLTAQLTASVTVGSYCVAVYDPGTLTVPVTFLVRAVHP